MTTLEGKIALVTGISGSLGSSVGRILTDHGAVVAGTYLNREPGEKETAARMAVQCDVTLEASVAACFTRVEKELGSPSIIVHTAGGFASDGMLEATSVETWNRMISMNLYGSFLVLREAVRRLRKESYGRIILVSALSASGGSKGAGAYKVAKSGVASLVRIAHAERSSTNMTVNALAPGTMDTPQNRKDMPGADTSSWVPPDRIAQTVLHLCSEAGGAISGSIIPFE